MSETPSLTVAPAEDGDRLRASELAALIEKAKDRAKHEASYTFDLPDGRVRYEPGEPQATLYGQLASALSAERARVEAVEAALAAMTAERDEARASARKMHRRCQQGEGDLLSRLAHLKSGNEWWRIQAEAAERKSALAEARADRLTAEVARKDAALKPFAFGDPIMESILFDGMPDDAPGTFTIKLGDIRAARRALTPITDGETDGA